MPVEVIVEDPRWEEIGLERLADGAVAAAFSHLGIGSGSEVALLAADDARIAELNAAFRGKGQATNVLSWPSEERGAAVEGAVPEPPEAGELGDMALAFETCLAEAEAAGIPFADHVTHLIVHGLLHLLGYDHVRDGDGDLMEATETAILAGLGIPDPYVRGGTGD